MTKAPKLAKETMPVVIGQSQCLCMISQHTCTNIVQWGRGTEPAAQVYNTAQNSCSQPRNDMPLFQPFSNLQSVCTSCWLHKGEEGLG